MSDTEVCVKLDDGEREEGRVKSGQNAARSVS